MGIQIKPQPCVGSRNGSALSFLVLGSSLGSFVVHMRKAALTTGCSARAFPVLWGRNGLWPVMNSKGSRQPSLPASTWNCLLGAIYAPELPGQ